MRGVKENKISLEELIYCVMLSLLLCLKGIGLEEGSNIFRIGLLMAMFLFATKILIGKYSIRELMIIGFGILWGIISFFHIGSLSILIYALIILGMKNVSISRAMKSGVAIWSGCFVITVTAAIFLNRTGVQLVHEKLGLGPVIRESLGYSHPNVLHVTYIVLMTFVLYCCKKENAFRTIVLLLLGDAFVFMYSLSYTGLMISFLLIGEYIYFMYRSRISLIEKLLIMCILPMCIIVSTIMPYLVDSEGIIYRICNSILNNRIWAIKVFFHYYDINLWGQKILIDSFSLDNSYIYALAWHGVVFLIIMFIGYWLLIRDYLKWERRKELSVIITFLVAGLTEQFLFNSSIKNITFVFMGEVLFRLIQKDEKEIVLVRHTSCLVTVPQSWFKIIKQKWDEVCWKRVVIHYICLNFIIILALLLLKTSPYNQVYVNEKLCDCSADLVSADQINDSENTLIIGKTTDDNRFYYFTNENSKLIWVQNVRYKISLSIYLSLLCEILFIGGKKCLDYIRRKSMKTGGTTR